MSDPYLAPSLKSLFSEVNSRWPNRSKASDGWLGDAAHSNRESDHNPDPSSDPPNVVRAADITASGVSPLYVVDKAIEHPSTEYVIYDSQIWSRGYGFRPRPYSGSSPHTTHIHVSIQHSAAAENANAVWLTTEWPLQYGHTFGCRDCVPAIYVWSRRRIHDGTANALHARWVRMIQGAIGVEKTGVYGDYTRRKVLEWQKGFRTTNLTGRIGPADAARLGLL